MTNPIPDVQITRDNIAKCESIVEGGFLRLWLSYFKRIWTAPAVLMPYKDELVDAAGVSVKALLSIIALFMVIALLPILVIHWFIGSAVSYRKIRLWIQFAKNHLDSK